MRADGRRGACQEHAAGAAGGWGIFQAFCERLGVPYVPASPQTIRTFIEDCVKKLKKPATIRHDGASERARRVHVEDVEFTGRGRKCRHDRRSDVSEVGESGEGRGEAAPGHHCRYILRGREVDRESTRMPMRYGEEVLAARGGMARAAEAQGRDDAGQMYLIP